MTDKNMEAQITVEFNEAESRQSLNSGDDINTLFGKIKRFLSDLNPVAFTGISDNIHFGTTAYWNSQSTLIGKNNHIYVYTDYTTITSDGEIKNVPNIKIGDGNAYLIDNPFITTSIEDLLQSHIGDNIKHITDDERSLWNGKVTCYLSAADNETIVFTTD